MECDGQPSPTPLPLETPESLQASFASQADIPELEEVDVFAPLPPLPPKLPGFLQSYHISQADIPELPTEYRDAPEFYWNYGWSMSMEEVRAFLLHCRPRALDDDPPTYVLLAAVASFLTTHSGWYGVRHVFVQPTDTVKGLSEMATIDGRPGVSFFMIVSTASRYYFEARPTKDEMVKLVNLIGKEPCWMKDAIEKKLWHKYYTFHI
ncbi:hypothetical protein BD626DRAFT_572506 [Schizophyllum amplum]|uniref:Uncharacterized protein n=1 Tax=Schizophyllum amplum TaxID=97359 RepID=A0A550C417_9AGAR|nr:hypothetical protein BD626DRAFT_572506 [Auriculariopsis ampla]